MGASTVTVIGGTGGQGVPIVEKLAQRGYHIRILTRNPDSEHAQKVAALNNVSLVVGEPENEEALRKSFELADYAFVNLNTWVLGVKNETYLGIRAFQLAVQAGVKHYIWSSLDNFVHETNFTDDLRAVHYYGKGQVEQWMSALPQTPMRWSTLTTSPYIEQLFYLQRPKKTEDGTYEFRLPLGDGAVPYTYLGDLGYYVDWIFSNPEESAGLYLKVGIEHVSLRQLAEIFTEVTGKPARGANIAIDEWFQEVGWGPRLDVRMGSPSSKENEPSLITFRQAFRAWWEIYQRSGGNTGLLRRDYALLDRIHPGRVRTLKQWMEKVGYNGETRREITTTKPQDMVGRVPGVPKISKA